MPAIVQRPGGGNKSTVLGDSYTLHERVVLIILFKIRLW